MWCCGCGESFGGGALGGGGGAKEVSDGVDRVWLVGDGKYFDGGDGVTAGWGWVLCGEDLGDEKGVLYTSDDNGATWVLRHKMATNTVIESLAFSNYTTDLEKA